MAPAAVYEIVRQQEGKGEYGYIDPIKKTITVKPQHSNNTISTTVQHKPREPDILDVAGAFFPPAKLLTLGRLPVGTTTPSITYEGSPEAMAAYSNLMPSGATTTDTASPLDSINEVIGAVGKALPILILIAVAGAGIGLFSKFKGLF